MSVAQTAGVKALARILVRLSDGSPLSVSTLSTEEGLARSTSFDIVSRMEAAQLLVRTPRGALSPGSAAVDFGFSALGLGRFHGPMQATLIWLRDHADASVGLTAEMGGEELALLSLPALSQQSGAGDLPFALAREIPTGEGSVTLRLTLSYPQGATRGERAMASAYFERAVVSLSHYLKAQTNIHDHPA